MRGIGGTGSHGRVTAEIMQELQGRFMHPRRVSTMDQRHEASTPVEGTSDSRVVETSFGLSSGLKSRASGDHVISSGSHLQVTDSGGASGSDSNKISSMEKQSPGAGELVVTPHARAKGAMMHVVTEVTKNRIAEPTKADRDVRAALLKCKQGKGEMAGNLSGEQDEEERSRERPGKEPWPHESGSSGGWQPPGQE